MALPIDDVVLDFCQLGAPDPETDQVPGLLIATPREPVLAAVAAVEKANLRVARVDLSSFGTLRAIADETPRGRSGHRPRCAPDHDRHPRPRRAEAGAHAGPRRREAHRAARRPAEPHRRSRPSRPSASRGLENPSKEIGRALVEALRPLLAEIRTSIGYFRSTNDTAPIERISLTGGGAHLRGIAAALEEQIGLPTRVVDPMQHIRNRLASKQVRAADPTYAPERGIGRPRDGSSSMTTLMARPGNGDTLWASMPGWGIVADLTPPELVESRRLKALRKLIAVCLGAVVLLLRAAGYALRLRQELVGLGRRSTPRTRAPPQLTARAAQVRQR